MLLTVTILVLYGISINAQDIASNEDFSVSKQIQDKFQIINQRFHGGTKVPKSIKGIVKSYSKKLKKSKKITRKHVQFTKKKVKLEVCGCHRQLYVNEDNDSNSNQTMCSLDSSLRGNRQKVISYSLYGQEDSIREEKYHKHYFQGVFSNYKSMRQHYPDWIFRLYFDFEDNDPRLQILCHFACKNPGLDLCHVKKIPALGDIEPIFPMIWRFLPTIDPQVDYFMSRDLDALIVPREVIAVKEWIKSGKALHVMRDHYHHGNCIVGCCWGLKLSDLEKSMMASAFALVAKDSILYVDQEAYGEDQQFLRWYVWPWTMSNSLSHDSYYCNVYPHTSPFPTERKIESFNYVSAFPFSFEPYKAVCPQKCRPKNHPEWEYC